MFRPALFACSWLVSAGLASLCCADNSYYQQHSAPHGYGDLHHSHYSSGPSDCGCHQAPVSAPCDAGCDNGGGCSSCQNGGSHCHAHGGGCSSCSKRHLKAMIPKYHAGRNPKHPFLYDWLFRQCDMPQHMAYYPEDHGYYYFRPYNYTYVPIQQEIAAGWGGDPRNPYDNRILQDVYNEFVSERHGVAPLEPIAPIAPAAPVVPAPPVDG